MATRLGEFLVREGKLTESQLSTVLERQVTMGGRIGTNLVELGYISEEDLARFLSKKLNVPSVDPAVLETISEKVTSIIPKEVAEKRHVVPFALDKKSLYVAMIDPTDLEAVDELSFLTGLSVKPYLSSEVRLRLALERYYHIGRPLRYISILNEERHRLTRLSERRTDRREPTQEEFEQFMTQAKGDFIHGKNRDEIFAVLLKNLCLILDRVILFGIKGGQITMLMSLPLCDATLESELEAPLVELPAFLEVVQRKLFYQGEIEPSSTLTALLKTIGGGDVKEIIILPLLIGGETVGLIYGDNAQSRRAISNAPILKKLMNKAAMALEILILKKKILEL